MSTFVDTNIFIRLLSSDDPAKASRCLALFERAERGEGQLVTSESVVAEVVCVLASPALYNLPRSEVARRLRPAVESRGLKIEHKASFLHALELYEQSDLDFEDCLSVAHIRRERHGSLCSYDRGFDRVPEIKRMEP